MYDDIILPVRNKIRVPSRSQTRIRYVEVQTNKSLFFIKWVELVMSLLCLCFTVIALANTSITMLNTIVFVMTNIFSIFTSLLEIVYPWIKSALPIPLQIVSSGGHFILYGIVTIIIYQLSNPHDLIKTLFFLHGFTCILFLVDFMSKIIIATYIYQSIRVRSVVDAAVSAFLPPVPPQSGRTKPPRSILTATPITYGGTFPVGKDEPPFLPEDRNTHCEGCHTPDKGGRCKSMQTPHCGDSKAVGGAILHDFGPVIVERFHIRNKTVQTSHKVEEKGTITPAPFYLIEERRNKKSPWTSSSPTCTKRIEARKQASMSTPTPITYSGTFAVNRNLVPITPGIFTGSSPKSSPRGKKLSSRSEGTRSDYVSVDTTRLNHISEEKILLDNCSLTMSSCSFYDGGYLPGSVLEDHPEPRKNEIYHE